MSWTFGSALRARWGLDPNLRYLNHGTVGAPPLAVLEEQWRIQREIERQPARFLLRDLAPNGMPSGVRNVPHLREAVARVAAFLGARGEDMAFVDNATTGIYGLLRSIPLEPGDGLLVADQGYGGVNNGARYAARERGLALQTWTMPTDDPRPERLLDAFRAGLKPNTRLAVVDQIHSGTGLVLAVDAFAAICREHDVLLIVDAAHVPGCIEVDVPALGADFWVGNLHKWAWSPRSSAVLWCTPPRQRDIHPAVISWGLDQGFAEEYDLLGTRDPSPHLTAPFALALLAEAGDVMGHNRDLARAGAEHVAVHVGGALLGEPSQWASMVPVLLPAELAANPEEARLLKDCLLFEHHIEAQVTWLPQGACLRVAAQIYNELEDYEALADALRTRL